MTIENKSIVFVRKDATTLTPDASLLITFRPSNGPALFTVRHMVAPDDVITGSRTSLVPNADDLIAQGMDGEPLGTTLRPVFLAAASVKLGPALDFDNVLTDGGGLFEPQPPFPPLEPKPSVRVEVFRGNSSTPEVFEDLAFEGSPVRTVRTEIAGIPPHIVGTAGELWTARFTNISDKPIVCFAKVLFRELRRLEVTRLPLQLLGRLTQQIVDGLELHIELDGSTATLEFGREATNLFKLPRISKDFDFEVFNNVTISGVRALLDHGVPPGESERVPLLQIIVEFEEDEPEISIDLGVSDIDVQISGLQFTLQLFLTNEIFTLAGNGRLRGNFPWVPFIKAVGRVETDVQFSSRALGVVRAGINRLLDVADAATFLGTLGKRRIRERLPTLRGAFIRIGEELLEKHWLPLSNFLQVGIQAIVNRDFEFHGIRSAGNDWEVISGPVPPVGGLTPAPGFPSRPASDTTPMDGSQPESELDNLMRVNHFVLLMLENRSYDHVLGHLTHPRHGGDPVYDGLTGEESNQITNIEPDAEPAPMPNTRFFPSPPHSFEPVMNQISDGDMSGFGEEFRLALERKNLAMDPRSIMNFHVPGQLRNYERLVSEFSVAKRWFASHPGPTWPNRLCTLTGATAFLDNSDIPIEDLGYLDFATIFDLLDEADINWRYYEHDLAFLRMIKKFRLESARIRPFERFAEDAKAGLPPVTFIDPNFVDIPSGGVVNDDHPGGADMINGQTLVAAVINALMESPGWDNTLLVITYDEHGGFFDHVPPPGSARSAISEVRRVNRDGPEMLGVRVPAFIVSPRAEAGGVLDRVYDHTSFVKSILTRFLPGDQHKLGRRAELAAHLGGAVPLEVPRSGFTPYPLLPDSDAFAGERVDPGSFHDHMRLFANPMRLSRSRLEGLMPHN